LRWLNGAWIRENLSPEQLADRLHAWAFNRENLLKILPLAQTRIETLSDFAPLASFFVSGALPIQESDFVDKDSDKDAIAKILQFVLWRLEALSDWQRDRIFDEVSKIASGLNLKIKACMGPLFVAISGSRSSVSVIDAMAIIGPDMTRARLRHAVDVLGGISKKRTKELEKEYAELSRATLVNEGVV
jgi:glutamyl-tRNA synthetase